METRFLNKNFKMKQTIKEAYDQERDELHKKKAEQGMFDEFNIMKKKNSKISNTGDKDADTEKEMEPELEGGADAGTNI